MNHFIYQINVFCWVYSKESGHLFELSLYQSFLNSPHFRKNRAWWIIQTVEFVRFFFQPSSGNLGFTPHSVTVTTRIFTFLVGNPCKPSFATVTGLGADPKQGLLSAGAPARALRCADGETPRLRRRRKGRGGNQTKRDGKLLTADWTLLSKLGTNCKYIII